jgi:membrane associated rhomboid family serine protease
MQVTNRNGVLVAECANCQKQVVLPPSAAPPGMAAQQSAWGRFPVTTALVAANALVFIAMALAGVSPVEPSVPDLLRWGADFGPYTLDHQWWRMLSSAFVHGGIFHIGFNMWAFWNLGRLAERIFGRWTYLLVYLSTAIAASLLSLFLHPVRVSVGASGAIFGVAGALITALKLGKLPIPAQNLKAILRSLLAFAGYNLFFGAVVPVIDNSAHLGGFLFGLLAGALLSRTLTADAESRAQQSKVVFVVLLVLLAGAGAYLQQSRGYVTAQKYRDLIKQSPPQ